MLFKCFLLLVDLSVFYCVWFNFKIEWKKRISLTKTNIVPWFIYLISLPCFVTKKWFQFDDSRLINRSLNLFLLILVMNWKFGCWLPQLMRNCFQRSIGWRPQHIFFRGLETPEKTKIKIPGCFLRLKIQWELKKSEKMVPCKKNCSCDRHHQSQLSLQISSFLRVGISQNDRMTPESLAEFH